MVAGQADDALDQMHGGVDGIVEDDDLAALDGGRREGDRRTSTVPRLCLSTRRKSPTRRVGSMDPEGMRKGWTEKVMMKMATTMM